MLKHIVLASLVAVPAFAFELRTNSANGDVVRWKNKVEFVIAPGLSEALGVPNAEQAVIAAVQAVAAQTPGLELTVRQGVKQPRFGYGYSDSEQSDIMFLDEEWPWEKTALAATVVSYNAWTNEVLDADIVINRQHAAFQIFDRPAVAGENRYDLQNTLTHELGHALGLMHNDDVQSVMYPSSAPGETSKRTLGADDIAGLEELYVKTPEPQPVMGCSATAAAPVWLVNLGLLLAFRRRAKVAATVVAVSAAAAVAAEPVMNERRTVEPEEIAWGEVVNTNSRWMPNTKLIVTELEVEVQQCVKGACAEKRVKLTVPGGRVGDIVQVIDHLPEAKRGSQVVLTRREGKLKMVVAR